jgi:hypothetical protein
VGAEHAIYLRTPVLNDLLFDVILLRYLLDLINFFHLFRFEHAFVNIDLKRLTNQIIGFVSREKRSEEYLSVDCSDSYRVVKDDSIGLFLYFFDILLGDLDESSIKEDVARVEARTETYPFVRDVDPA